jgi:hypothetical protein
MKSISNTYSIFLLVLLVLGGCKTDSSKMETRSQTVSGTWSGTFLDPNLELTIDLKVSESNAQIGSVQLKESGLLVQNDPLSDLTIQNHDISFSIPDKNTSFQGRFENDLSELVGIFRFPDGTEHPYTGLISLDPDNRDPSSKNILSQTQIQEDMSYLDSLLRNHHPALFQYQTEDDYLSSLERLTQAPETDTHVELFYRLLAPVVAGIGCSHTIVEPPGINFGQSEDLSEFIIACKEGHFYLNTQYLGKSTFDIPAQVTTINGYSSKELVNILYAGIPSDASNAGYKYWFMNNHLDQLLMSLADVTSPYRIESIIDGKKRIDTLSVLTASPQNNKTVDPSKGNQLPYQLEVDERLNIAKLTIRGFAAPDPSRYINDLHEFFQMLKDRKIEKMVLDVRGNPGGHPLFAAELLKFLIPDPFNYFDSTLHNVELQPLTIPQIPSELVFNGYIAALIDPGCTSTTAQFISILKSNREATLIGQTTGAGFRCNDYAFRTVLPHSKLVLHIPRQQFSVAVPEAYQTALIEPDITVKPALFPSSNSTDLMLQSAYGFLSGDGL